jgi:mannose-6-phosphate isomerase-like protein (cupin superfamily)
MDLETWGAQPLYWSERMRGRGLVWPRTASWFVNDPLGPQPHAHPRASELYVVAAGRLEVVVGSERHELAAGDVCLIPEGAYHDPASTLGSDLGLFCVVSPNWRGERWQTEGFDEAAFAASARCARTDRTGPIPSDHLLESEVRELAPGEDEEIAAPRGHRERVLYVLAGEMELTVEALRGRLRAHRYAHIPAYVRHRVRSVGEVPLRVLSVWSADGVPEGV